MAVTCHTHARGRRADARRTVLARAAVTLLAACGDDDGPASEAPSSTAPTTTTPEATDRSTSPDADAVGATDDGEADPADGADEAAGDDLCALLADVDLAAVLAEPPGEPQSSPESCIVRAADPASRARVDVGLRPTGGADAYQRNNEIVGIDAPLTGIGDEAVRAGLRVHARKGDAFVSVQVVRNVTTNGHIPDAELEALARTVAAAAGW